MNLKAKIRRPQFEEAMIRHGVTPELFCYFCYISRSYFSMALSGQRFFSDRIRKRAVHLLHSATFEDLFEIINRDD